eukprot:Amastigsp_a174479_91.p2 type:complete len:122 gc:universal Amastigsp_a174479_91:636-271(-)
MAAACGALCDAHDVPARAAGQARRFSKSEPLLQQRAQSPAVVGQPWAPCAPDRGAVLRVLGGPCCDAQVRASSADGLRGGEPHDWLPPAPRRPRRNGGVRQDDMDKAPRGHADDRSELLAV